MGDVDRRTGTDRWGWTRSGLVVITLGVASNLALTFVPDVVPDRAAEIVVYCMTAVVIVVAPLWVYRELVESSRRLEDERRRMRGIEAAGSDFGREADTYAVWSTAEQGVLCFGVGLTGASKDVERIAAEGAAGRVRVHTYRSWPQHSATIADPWTEEPKGYVEFHVFRRRRDWVRIVASGFDGPRIARPCGAPTLPAIDRLVGDHRAPA